MRETQKLCNRDARDSSYDFSTKNFSLKFQLVKPSAHIVLELVVPWG